VANHEASNYAVISTLLLLSLSYVQTFFSALCSQILKWTIREMGLEIVTGTEWLRIRFIAGFYFFSKDRLGSITAGKTEMDG
jgi:apolipoprotein N-acyltransferase